MNDHEAGHVDARALGIETLASAVVLAAIAGAAYFWSYSRGNDLAGSSVLASAQERLAGMTESPAELAQSLSLAQAKLSKQSAALAAMKADFPSSPELNKQVADAYAAAAAAVAQTDNLFNDPDSDDPTLKNADADPAAAAAIADLRRELNDALASWKGDSAGDQTTFGLSQDALADLALMQKYVNQLENYFNDLPPTNEFESTVVIADEAQLSDDASAINRSINDIDSIGGPAPVVAAADAGGGSSASSADQSGSGASGGASDDASSTASADGQPVVTVGDITSLQNDIDDTDDQIDTIQQQIQTYTAMPESDSGSNGGNSGGSDAPDTGANTDQPWVPPYVPPVDPGSPSLIQGDNPFQ